MSAVELFKLGYQDLVSVIPPGANLSPASKVKPSSCGKAPGRRGPNGWAGYPWQGVECSLIDAERMDRDKANVGLASTSFPALDIDCTDEQLSAIVERIALEVLGPAPQRVGAWPKRLLMYRTEEPFGRMRLWVKQGGAQHLIEMLGRGQQFVVHGIHAGTGEPYKWGQDIPEPAVLSLINRDDVQRFFERLEAEIEFLGCEFEREGSGTLPEVVAVDQAALRAPSLKALAEAVDKIPNDAPGYDEYVTMGIAIKAAGQHDPVSALEIFQRWAARWENGDNDPGDVARDWARMRSPYRIGWDWIAPRARRYGYCDAVEEFTVPEAGSEETLTPAASSGPVEYSDRCMSNRFVSAHGKDIRYCDQLGGWLVWDGARWAVDDTHQVECLAGETLAKASGEALARPDFSAQKADRLAHRLASQAGRAAVVAYSRADRRVAASVSDFDQDPLSLNTPGGVVDLSTGALRARTSQDMFMACAAVTPTMGQRPRLWLDFLGEVTDNDKDMLEFLQIWAGYCLTGQTIEQKLAFLYGHGGNGKSVFVGTLAAVMGSYAGKAAMEAFTITRGERHPTELAALRAYRMVYASETADGGRWNEGRLKEITGGEPIRARFMHKDEFTYTPQFKLLFLGNSRPELRSIDEGMRRRLLLVPFTRTPARPDPFLAEKLREEWGAILGWAIEGAVIWHHKGLTAPRSVAEATEEYFTDEDALGRWISERCYVHPAGTALTQALYDDWRLWCGENGEFPGKTKGFSVKLRSRGFAKWRDGMTGRAGLKGLELLADPGLGPARQTASAGAMDEESEDSIPF